MAGSLQDQPIIPKRRCLGAEASLSNRQWLTSSISANPNPQQSAQSTHGELVMKLFDSPIIMKDDLIWGKLVSELRRLHTDLGGIYKFSKSTNTHLTRNVICRGNFFGVCMSRGKQSALLMSRR